MKLIANNHNEAKSFWSKDFVIKYCFGIVCIMALVVIAIVGVVTYALISPLLFIAGFCNFYRKLGFI